MLLETRFIGKRLLAAILACMIFFSGNLCTWAQSENRNASFEAMQCAQILGVQDEVNRLMAFGNASGSAEHESDEMLAIRAVVLRKILMGWLDVRKATNKIDMELAYTYDIMQRQQRKQYAVNQLFNLANFIQFGTTYAIEGRSRIHEQFIQSSVLTCVSAGLGLTLPTMDIMYNKLAKAKDVAPPKFLSHVLEGGPVDASGLPEFSGKYLNSSAQGSSRTRKEEMFVLWKKHYGADPANRGTLASLLDGKSQSAFALHNRIVLLWSLRRFVSGFDRQLYALLDLVKLPSIASAHSRPPGLGEYGLPPAAVESAKLLGIEPEFAELVSLNRTNGNPRRRLALEAFVLERILLASLDVRIAVGKIMGELNYAYDVALSELMAQRGKWLQKNFELNFMKTGILGAIAGLCYLKGYTFAGNQLFVINSAVGTGQSTLTLLLLHGGWKKNEGPPNSLADLFDLNPSAQYKFSPLLSDFLNSADPDSKRGLTRKDELFEIWKRNRVTTMGLKSEKNKEKLASMPGAKWDTIKILLNRIALLTGLRTAVERMDIGLLALIKGIEDGHEPNRQGNQVALSKSAAAAADLLAVQPTVLRIQHLKATVSQTDVNLTEQRFDLMREIMRAALEVRTTAAYLGVEIAQESQTLDRMTRERDKVVTLTNNANFYQIGILGMIIDGPLGCTTKPRRLLYGNRMTIISGLLVCGLACAAFVEQVGGIRLSKAKPNMLGTVFNLDTEANSKFSPLLVKFLNSVAPDSQNNMTRREELIKYWKEAKILTLNVARPSTAQRLAAAGRSHHFWNEDMRLIRNRVNMLFDLRAVISLMDVGLLELLDDVG